MWVGRDGGLLLVLTPVGSGKVKRLRHDPRVELAVRAVRCGRGRRRAGVRDRRGPGEAGRPLRARATIRRTYPIESRIVLGIERLVERLRGRPDAAARLHITAA